MSFSRSLLSKTSCCSLITESHWYSKGLSVLLKGKCETVLMELNVVISVVISVILHYRDLYMDSAAFRLSFTFSKKMIISLDASNNSIVELMNDRAYCHYHRILVF